GDERRSAQRVVDGAEGAGAEAWNPPPGLCGQRPGRDVPCRRESPEMIEADGVDVSEQGAQTIDAPAIPAQGQRVPVVDWIAPELSLRAEIVRRNPGEDGRSVARVEQKQRGVGREVARIRREEERSVADQPDDFGA